MYTKIELTKVLCLAEQTRKTIERKIEVYYN
jgi:hypothetical protein